MGLGFSSKKQLPAYCGPLPVGSLVLELSVPEEFRCEYKTIEHKLRTVKVRIFYPLDPTKDVEPRTDELWLPFHEGIPEVAKGFRWWLLRAFASGLTNLALPVYKGELFHPPNNGKLPVFIFSHGLVGSRNVYSSLCGTIASYGIVVLAMEHRDNSAIISTVRDPLHPEEPPYVVQYREISDFYADATVVLQNERLLFRQQEIQIALQMIRNINDLGTPDENLPFLCSVDSSFYNSVFQSMKGNLNTAQGELIVAGHSFGAATCAFISGSSTKSLYNDYMFHTEFKCSILYDIWMLPVRQLHLSTMRYPTLMIISYEFRRFVDNFQALESWLVNKDSENQNAGESADEKMSVVPLKKYSHVFVYDGTVHANQSDLPILLPRMVLRVLKGKFEADPYEALRINTRSSVQFLRENHVENVQGDNDPSSLQTNIIPGWERIM
ncbi:putative phospholipase A2 [Schizosaccharomyces pombe]|uniref:Putative phospholipase A2 n=1 Tax=Schizosaccharomyces pombe (strain 972 / ATCC 24843) TaxID=284812 RepID=PLG7_SCHPO|nr:1-alkyl-2-acetylglycerophosphocholine esterase [Schizosaccharomyces pombe]Q9URV1.1 RecName: Full=Putative phospholipase A2; AltName: Full=1-alkyl-2-acetylglycerophosphocholine esterase; AltName: Full=2-acetyl-1-alkylglycerophosphocholine esterase [Schizosaccharomyces pombe 972h-]CAB53727.1 phospholipase A2, PAF family homolog [Schizosaccharomyces pombe]|eukprot:NP_595160.1 1-alkyl-2-acetylglycerophosphocholine esterase [Schizosaccharomyces pombe]